MDRREDLTFDVFLQQIKAFMNKLRLRDSNLYTGFLNIFSQYKEGLIQLEDITTIVSGLLEHHQDLHGEFLLVIKDARLISPPENRSPSSMEDSVRVSKKKNERTNCQKERELKEQCFRFCSNVQKKLSYKNYSLFLSCFCSFNSGEIEKDFLENNIRKLISEFPQLVADFKVFLKSWQDYNDWFSSRKVEEEQSKSSEDNNRACKRLRTNLPKSEQEKKRIEIEQIRLKCEDDRTETDLLLSWFNSAMNYAEKLSKGDEKAVQLSGINKSLFKGVNGGLVDSGEEVSEMMETYIDGIGITKELRIMNKIHFKRCVEHLYGDDSDEIFEILYTNPIAALANILPQLEQKKMELEDFKTEMKKIWARLP